MKTGLTFAALKDRVSTWKSEKRDFLVPSSRLSFFEADHKVRASLIGTKVELAPNDVAHEQLSARLQIPKPYYDRMLQQQPELLTRNLNTWLAAAPRDDSSIRMIRSRGDVMRAVLSRSYRSLDYEDLAQVLFAIMDKYALEMQSSDITDRRFYFKATSPKMTVKIKGDEVQWGIQVTDSEVGLGAVEVRGFSVKLSCLNGAVHDVTMSKRHVGRRHQILDDSNLEMSESDQSKHLSDALFWSRFKDSVENTLSDTTMRRFEQKMNAATERPVVHPEMLEVICLDRGVKDIEMQMVSDIFFGTGDLTQFGLAQAVTNASSKIESYDRASELERTGGEILELEDKDWEQVVRNFERRHDEQRKRRAQ